MTSEFHERIVALLQDAKRGTPRPRKKEPTWKTQDGKIIKISGMTDLHLRNTIAMLERESGKRTLCEEDVWWNHPAEFFFGKRYLNLCEERDKRKEAKNGPDN